MMKFGGGIRTRRAQPGSSLNVGSRSYINGFDQNNDYNPLSPGFVEESALTRMSCSRHFMTT